MNAPAVPVADPVVTLLALQSRARQAPTAQELLFLVANETWRLVPYRQAFVFVIDAAARWRLEVASGLATLDGDTPFTLFLDRAMTIISADPSPEARFVDPAALPADLREEWPRFLPPQVLFAPLPAPDGTVLGGVLYAFDQVPGPGTQELLAGLHEAYGHALRALQPRVRPWMRLPAQRRRLLGLVLIAAVALSLFVPVRLSALAPAEIAPVHAQIVASPLDGVVSAFHVRPNQAVKQGDKLFSLDETTLRSRRDVAIKAVAVARAEMLTATQKAFESDKHREEVAVLQGRVHQREAEAAMLDELLTRVDVAAPRDGVAVFSDENDWLGRPVVTGERIVLLADPGDAGVTAWLPVADAIGLDPGARMRVFLHVAPLAPVEAVVTETSYQASTSPDGVVAYRIRGTLAPGEAGGRLGLKGTAKLYGESVPLGYLLFRRPIAALREWTGL
ncbi:MAG: HlyD family efflux transporter periplasmic adaptor subunit [Burkholderiales bacterium]